MKPWESNSRVNVHALPESKKMEINDIESGGKVLGWGVTAIAVVTGYAHKVIDHGKRLRKLESVVYPEESSHRLATVEDLKEITGDVKQLGTCLGEIKVSIGRLEERTK